MSEMCESRLWLETPENIEGSWIYCEKPKGHSPDQAHSTADGYAWFDTVKTQVVKLFDQAPDTYRDELWTVLEKYCDLGLLRDFNTPGIGTLLSRFENDLIDIHLGRVK